MKRLLIATACLAFFASALVQSALAQAAEEPASRDDVILYLRVMHTHDLMQKMIQVQSQTMQQMLHDQLLKDKSSLPADFETRFQKAMADLFKNMPLDEMSEAMIPAYQKHFTKGDLEAMSAFYSSPVGQKVLEVLPSVMQDGMQAAMPIMTKYIDDWKTRMGQEMKTTDKSAPAPSAPEAAPQN
jgi:uncharacterized protein